MKTICLNEFVKNFLANRKLYFLGCPSKKFAQPVLIEYVEIYSYKTDILRPSLFASLLFGSSRSEFVIKIIFSFRSQGHLHKSLPILQKFLIK